MEALAGTVSDHGGRYSALKGVVYSFLRLVYVEYFVRDGVVSDSCGALLLLSIDHWRLVTPAIVSNK
jgi:hypothetical protein